MMSSAFENMASMTIAMANVAETTVENGVKQQGLLDFTPTFIIVAINLLILYFLLNKFLFSKLTPFMEKRSMSIQESLANAEKANAFAESMRTEYSQKMKQAHSDIEKMIEEAKLSAVKESENIIKIAKNEATQIVGKAKEEIDKERVKMMKEIRSEVAGLALSAASKVVEANLNTETNAKLVEKFINEAGVA